MTALSTVFSNNMWDMICRTRVNYRKSRRFDKYCDNRKDNEETKGVGGFDKCSTQEIISTLGRHENNELGQPTTVLFSTTYRYNRN